MPDASLILLPGLDGTGVMFRPLLRHLPKQIKPTVVSYPPDKMLSYAQLLPQVLAAIPVGQPHVILGESFSGPLSILAAATCPAGLTGLILCASFVQNPVWFRPRWLRHLSRPLPFRLFPLFTQIKAHACGYATNELTALKAESLANVRPEVIAHRVRSTLTVNVISELKSCHVPILYLRGNRDFVVPRHNLRQITRIRPEIQIARFSSPHMVLQTQPAAAADAIASFIASLGTQDPEPPHLSTPQHFAAPTSPAPD